MIFDRRLHWVALLIGLWPMIPWWQQRFSEDPNSLRGLLPLAFAGLLLWRDRLPGVVPLPSLATLIVLACYLGSWFWLPRSLTMMLALMAVAFMASSPGKPSLAVCLLIFLAMPWARDLEFFGGYPMRVVTGEITVWLLAGWGHDVVRTGTALEWHGGIVEVDAPCSGLRMMWSAAVLCTCVAGLLSLRQRQFLMLGLVTFVMVLAANSLRGAVLFFLEGGFLSAPPWAHSGVGAVIFLALTMAVLQLARRFGRAACRS